MTFDKNSELDKLYHLGATTIYASAMDARFSYALYVPTHIKEVAPEKIRIIVSVHGTGRMQALYRDMFRDFADARDCIVIAPLFAASVLGDGNLSGYKYILEGDIRYDLVMISIIDEVRRRYGVIDDTVMIFGFSGGGHFSHRFTILHPSKVRAASIGAAGSVTLLDESRPWWVGVKDVEERFGVAFEPEAFAGMPVHIVVGDADTENWEITFEAGDRNYMEGANDAGANRPARAASLARSFERYGATVRLETVAGAVHDVTSVVDRTLAFFGDILDAEAE